MKPPTRRFVVLHHRFDGGATTEREDHFDWMFQSGDTLRTWASPIILDWQVCITLPCSMLADHRLCYLDYEGLIPNGRGSVARLFGGEFITDEESTNRFTARVRCDRLRGDYAEVEFQRILLRSDLPEEVQRAGWSIRWSPGRYETN